MNDGENSKIESLMYSHDDWSVVGNKPRPYCFHINNEKQVLYYFGANHSRDIMDQQYPKLKTFWEDFLNNSKRERIVLVEGGLRKLQKDQKTAVRNDSEAGFITFLASERSVEVISPEPEDARERQSLLKDFSRDQIQYYYFARLLPSWYHTPEPRPSFLDHISNKARVLKMGAENENWNGYDFSVENMKKVHKSIFGTDFNESDKDFILSVINPMTKKTIINEVSRASSKFRDVHIVSKICDLWSQGKSIFVVYGLAHAILQEPALRKLLV